MQLVEKHMIDRNHWLYKQLDNLCFLSKNLFNYANYPIRQKIISSGEYLDYYKIQKICQGTTDYLALPAKVSQQVLLRLHESWKSFFAATKEYNIHPDIATAKVLLVIERSRNVHFDPSTTLRATLRSVTRSTLTTLATAINSKPDPKYPDTNTKH